MSFSIFLPFESALFLFLFFYFRKYFYKPTLSRMSHTVYTKLYTVYMYIQHVSDLIHSEELIIQRFVKTGLFLPSPRLCQYLFMAGF